MTGGPPLTAQLKSLVASREWLVAEWRSSHIRKNCLGFRRVSLFAPRSSYAGLSNPNSKSPTPPLDTTLSALLREQSVVLATSDCNRHWNDGMMDGGWRYTALIAPVCLCLSLPVSVPRSPRRAAVHAQRCALPQPPDVATGRRPS